MGKNGSVDFSLCDRKSAPLVSN